MGDRDLQRKVVSGFLANFEEYKMELSRTLRLILSAILIIAFFTFLVWLDTDLDVEENPFLMFLVIFFAVLLYAAWNFGVVECLHCRKKSDKHEVLDVKRWERLKHVTKGGNPDKRYKDNLLQKFIQTEYRCVKCKKSFLIKETA
jgi:hypothetical protein